MRPIVLHSTAKIPGRRTPTRFVPARRHERSVAFCLPTRRRGGDWRRVYSGKNELPAWRRSSWTRAYMSAAASLWPFLRGAHFPRQLPSPRCGGSRRASSVVRRALDLVSVRKASSIRVIWTAQCGSHGRQGSGVLVPHFVSNRIATINSEKTVVDSTYSLELPYKISGRMVNNRRRIKKKKLWTGVDGTFEELVRFGELVRPFISGPFGDDKI